MVVCHALTYKQEAEDHSIDLPDEEPEIVEYMLQYMYGRDYRLPSDDAPRPFWIRWKWPEPTRTDEFRRAMNTTEENMRKIEIAKWSYSAVTLQMLHEKHPPLIEVHYTVSWDRTKAKEV